MPRKWTVLLAAVAVLLTSLCLRMSIGKTQARYQSEESWQMMCDPVEEEPESGFLRAGGQRVLMRNWDVSDPLPRTLLLELSEGQLTATAEPADLLAVHVDETQITLELTEQARKINQEQDAVVQVTWSADGRTLWADFCVTLLPEESALNSAEEESAGSDREPVRAGAESEGSSLVLWLMDHFDPRGLVPVQLAIPDQVRVLSITPLGAEVFPAKTRIILEDTAYMLYEDLEVLELSVTPGSEPVILFDFSAIDRIWETEPVVSMYLAGYTASSSIPVTTSDITVWANASLPHVPNGVPTVGADQPLQLTTDQSVWENSGCQWEAVYERLVWKDSALAYEPLEADTAFTLTVSPEKDCLLLQVKSGERVSAGSYRMILRLKLENQTISEQKIPFFVIYMGSG